MAPPHGLCLATLSCLFFSLGVLLYNKIISMFVPIPSRRRRRLSGPGFRKNCIGESVLQRATHSGVVMQLDGFAETNSMTMYPEPMIASVRPRRRYRHRHGLSSPALSLPFLRRRRRRRRHRRRNRKPQPPITTTRKTQNAAV